MKELSLFEIFSYAGSALVESKVFILFVLEALVLLITLVFKNFMDKKLVKRTSIIASLIILVLYISNYVSTLKTFIDNISTKFMEVMYFPTTLEFAIVMVISFIIMIVTLINKNNKKIIKIINISLPLSISFIFLSIIEYINVNKVDFDEFSVFTDVNLMSLYELAMGLFIAWLLGLIIYEIDKFIITRMDIETNISPKVDLDNKIEVLEDDYEEEIEIPKLKEKRS